MNAAIYKEYGLQDKLIYTNMEKPIPKDNEVLIKVICSSINISDLFMLTGKPFVARITSGLFKPKNPILGSDISGVIEELGKDVTQFKIGDEVFGEISQNKFGGFGQYTCTKENSLVLKPKKVSFEKAAAAPVATLASLQALKKGKIKANQDVLIYGASGGVGNACVQLAKAFDTNVTAVCSTRNIEIARQMGADKIIDYKKEDITTIEQKYDVIIGVNGNISIFDYKKLLKPNGHYVMVGGSGKQIFQGMIVGPIFSIFSRKKLTGVSTIPNRRDLEEIRTFLIDGKLVPYVDSEFSLINIREAFEHYTTKMAKGKIVISNWK